VTESEIQFLKENIDNTIEIETSDGERLVVKVLFVTCDKEYDEHELTYQAVSSSRQESYLNLENAGGYVLDFDKIESVKPLS
jgi:uncharacterized protein YxeA